MSLSEKQKDDVLKLFYRTELREGEVVINNTTPAISRELELPYQKVQHFLNRHTEKKIRQYNEKINQVETELGKLSPNKQHVNIGDIVLIESRNRSQKNTYIKREVQRINENEVVCTCVGGIRERSYNLNEIKYII